MYRMIYDHHTHTTFSHGKGSIEDNVKAAIKAGLSGIAITDHGPGHLNYGVKRDAIPAMRKEIERLNNVYPEIEILLGMETNIRYVGNYLDMNHDELAKLDIVSAGYHYGITKGHCMRNYLYKKGFLFRKEELRRLNTEMTIKALENNDIRILTHPGDKGPFDIQAIAKACAQRNVLMEINNYHDHLTVKEIGIAAGEGVNFVINSDAHHPSRVGRFQEGLARFLESGISIDRVDNIEEV